MRLRDWLRRLLGLGPPRSHRSPRTTATAPVERRAAPRPPVPPDELPPELEDSALLEAALPVAAAVGDLDRQEHITAVLGSEQDDLTWALRQRIEKGRFRVPQLPSTSIAAIHATNDPGADVGQLVELISTDPLLCSELLKTANSVLYATHVPAESLHDAVMRIGLRALRSLVFTASMRGAILKGHLLAEYAEEVWRQALSVAGIARAIAPELRVDPEHAFMLGLLQDIGKVALLTMLREEVRHTSEITPAVVGQVFKSTHELAGAAMAGAWKLSPELASVAGCHHAYTANPDYPRPAAIAFLAHQLDLYLSLGDEEGFRDLTRSGVMDFLEVPGPARWRIIDRARAAYQGAGVEAPAEAT
jgi:putative nucleotidyltransferase with HDIG domain